MRHFQIAYQTENFLQRKFLEVRAFLELSHVKKNDNDNKKRREKF